MRDCTASFCSKTPRNPILLKSHLFEKKVERILDKNPILLKSHLCGKVLYILQEIGEPVEQHNKCTRTHRRHHISMTGHPEIYIVHTCCTSKMPRWGDDHLEGYMTV